MTLPPLRDDVPPAVGEYLGAFIKVPNIPQSEDCLNLNVLVPAGTKPNSNLPVLVWIYGGGFQLGSNAVQPGHVIVNRSIELNQPVIYVAMNYRLSAFGWLGGREVKEGGIGNLGLQDQREALRWIQKYIPAFGGDPAKVTMYECLCKATVFQLIPPNRSWGESAGSISVALHMMAHGGNNEGLFRAGFMESGAALPSGDITGSSLQDTYDFIVADTGCASSHDSLECLRKVSVEQLTAAMDKTPTFFSYQQCNTPWFPRADGVFVAEPPEHLLLKGNLARVPVVVGNTEDEGTAFSLSTLNITYVYVTPSFLPRRSKLGHSTDEEFAKYVTENYYTHTNQSEIAKLLDMYPSDPVVGSPYGTEDSYAYTPAFKRMAAFQGDFIVQAPRRLFTQQLAEKQPVWSFMSQRGKITGLGAAHGTDLANVFGGGDMTDYLIRFAATLDPNGDAGIYWPRYTKESPQLLSFLDGEVPLGIINDTYRADAMELVTRMSLADPM
ncbi:Lipase 4 [Grifola frondosa]|uniref:Lipase 4 n=1 Tax=Grifola frondosa TaxID=5627 RepID=A0A1C7LS77_GRIFR|nr:Lipase 4 [Grifola frondosa]